MKPRWSIALLLLTILATLFVGAYGCRLVLLDLMNRGPN